MTDIIPIFLDFSHVYEQQNEINNIEHIMVDCTGIRGTNGYCDIMAAKNIRDKIHDYSDENGVFFIDNGNYHYVSSIRAGMFHMSFDMVVFDHHSDMQPSRFGGLLSCGSWINDVLMENKMIGSVVLIGHKMYTEEKYISDAVDGSRSGGRIISLTGNEPDIADILNRNLQAERPVFISIDKDVLSRDECPTNWDQGDMSFEKMKIIIGDIIKSGREICGIDVCGEPELAALASDIAKSGEINIQLIDFLHKCLKMMS